jgi:hypothetical protein
MRQPPVQHRSDVLPTMISALCLPSLQRQWQALAGRAYAEGWLTYLPFPRQKDRPESSVLDTTPPAGRMIFGIFATLAEFARDLIRERTMAGLAATLAVELAVSPVVV